MKNKIDSLQIIRALAFLGIFASHSDITVFSSGGAWGVSVFIVLSGFLMVYSYYGTARIKEHGFAYSIRFGVNKIRKLYPLHIVTLLLALLYQFIGFSGMNTVINPVVIRATTVITAANALLAQSWFSSKAIYFSLNAVSWYLSVSLFLYMMFPFILFQMRRYKGISAAVIVIAAAYVIQIILAYSAYLIQIHLIQNNDFVHWFTYIFPLSRLEDFVIGCNLGYIFITAKRDKGISEKLSTWLEFGTLLLIAIQLAAHAFLISIPAKAAPSVSAENWWGFTVMWTLTSCALVYLFALNKGKVSKLLTCKALLFIGRLSADAFLIHQLVYRYLNMFEQMLFGNAYQWINLFACFILTTASALTWELLMSRVKKES